MSYPTGETLAATGRLAVGASWATDIAGWCSKFIRQTFQKAGVTDDLWGGTAIATAAKWRAAGKVYSLEEIGGVAGIREGDVLFQEFGSPDENGKPQGHVSMSVGNGQIAENTWLNGIGKRIAPIAAMGKITGVGRLDNSEHPDPYAAYATGKVPTPATPAVGAPRPRASWLKKDSLSALAGTDLKTYIEGQAAEDRDRQEQIAEGPVGQVLAAAGAAVATYGADVLAVLGGALILALGSIAAVQGGR